MNELKTIAHRVLLLRGFQPEFTGKALAEAGSAVAPVASEDSGVRDLRALLWCSIDNDSSRDLDQLSVAESLPDGTVKVLVAVADVDAVVKRRSAVDEHAAMNTVSVYTAAGVYPMLPEHLSTNITSLGEDDDRLALVVELSVAPDGTLKHAGVYRALVHNHAKLAYNAVAAWLDGAPPPAKLAATPGLDQQIRLQERVAQAMRALRFRRGALSLQTPRAEAVFDGEALADIRADQPNRAKELIEDLMVAANGVVARSLAEKRFPSIRRVLRSPARWPRIVELAKQYETSLPAEPNGLALAQFLAAQRSAHPEKFADLSLGVVKLLGRGEYVVDLPGQPAIGHFGLASDDYSHSTAPNRRFADLITHRLLKAALAGEAVPYEVDELVAIARHCNDQEANAAKVERQVAKSAAALLLVSRVGQRFDGLVTGASDKGTWVRVLHPATEGKIVRGAQGLDIGDRIRVELLHVDVERGFIDFARVEAP